MNKFKKIGLIAAACICVSLPAAAVFESTAVTAEAHSHSRRADAGGYRDNRDWRGMRNDHYHCGGHPAHLHENGICPYSPAVVSPSGNNVSQASQQTVTREMMESYGAVFDAGYYYDHNEDLQSAIGNDSLKLFEHFISCGMAEGRRGCENFDVNVYRQNNSDLDEAFGDDQPRYYHHYMNCGCQEGRICH